MSRKSHLLVLRYRHFYTAKNNGKEKILTNIIKFIYVFKNGNPVMLGIILKLVLQEEDDTKISFSERYNFPPILWCQVTYLPIKICEYYN